MDPAIWTRLLPWIGATLIGFVYLPVLGFDYVWDDWHLFVHSSALRDPELVWKAIFGPVMPGTTYFRPMALGSFALEFATLGTNPSFSHGANLFIHLSNSVLVGLIALHLTAAAGLKGQAWRVLLATLLYGLHPALIEPAAWIAGRFDLLVTFFYLLALWGYLAFSDRKRDLWVTLCFILAATSKEMAVTLPLVLLLLYLGRQERTANWSNMARGWMHSREWRLLLLLAVAGLGYIIARHVLLGQIAHVDAGVNRMLDGPFHRTAFIGQTLLFYLRTSLWPFADLNPQHPLNPADLDTAARWIGVSVLVLAAVTVAILVRRRTWSGLLIAGWLITLLPVLNIAPLTVSGNIGQERFLTLPLALLVLGIVTLKPPRLSPMMSRSMPLLAGGVALCFLSLSLINIRVTLPLWTNDLSLWSWGYARYPNRPTVQAGYVAAAIRFQHYELAKTALDAAPQPLDHRLAAQQGGYLVRIGRPADALASFEQALATLGRPHEAILSRGISLDEVAIDQTRSQGWMYGGVYTGIAEAQVALREFEEALDAARIALFYLPRYPPAVMVESFALYGLDRWADAEKTFAVAGHYFMPDARSESTDLRSQFLTQLCAQEAAAPSVCANWSAERSVHAEPELSTPSASRTASGAATLLTEGH